MPFRKTLYNYAVRVDMLRDLRLAGGTAKRSLLYAATLEMLRYHEHRDRTFASLAHTHLRHVDVNANAEIGQLLVRDLEGTIFFGFAVRIADSPGDLVTLKTRGNRDFASFKTRTQSFINSRYNPF